MEWNVPTYYMQVGMRKYCYSALFIIHVTSNIKRNIQKHDTQAGTSVSTWREKKHRTPKENMEGPTSPWGLTFKNRASYILDGRTATLQMSHFIYFFNKYKYWVF